MFGSLASFTEGFKRLSLDALQEEEEGQTGSQQNLGNEPVSSNVEQGPNNRTVARVNAAATQQAPPSELPATPTAANQTPGQDDEWDWGQMSKQPVQERRGARGTAQNIGGTTTYGSLHMRQPTTGVDSANGSVPVPEGALDATSDRAEAPSPVCDDGAEVGHGTDSLLLQVSSNKVPAARESAEVQEDDGELGVDTALETCRKRGMAYSGADEHAASAITLKQSDKCARSTGGTAESTGSSSTLLATAPAVGSANANGENDEAALAADSTNCVSPLLAASELQDNAESALTPRCGDEARAEPKLQPLPSAGEREGPPASSVNDDSLAEARNELAATKSLAAVLQNAVSKSQAEIQGLREELSAEKRVVQQKTRDMAKLRYDVEAARMGYRESSEAHQRTAERAQGMERELRTAKEAIDNLKAEKSSLLGQLNVALEGRQALEAQLREMHAGLTEGQEVARKEGRIEAERLETRVKELLKERDRKQAELDLQHARRKETREMARDLESQLAGVERLAQDREVELKKLTEERNTLRREVDEARAKESTWASKHEALDRNFKQVRAQGRNVDSEVDQLRKDVARLEVEKATLAERVEEEGAERVTVVASISHERDFLLRQVDRLEKEVHGLRQKQQARSTAEDARAQKAGVLEEYRTRAQQALKRANEVTNQTASENKRLQAELAKISAEVDQERPLWKNWKEEREVDDAKMTQLMENLAKVDSDRATAAKSLVVLENHLVRKEEERRSAHTAVMRLEAQGKSLKQELQRQQKALSAAQRRESELRARLAEKESSLQAMEDCQPQQPLASPRETKSDVDSYNASPRNHGGSLALGWDDEKAPERKGTGPEIGDKTQTDPRVESVRNSFRSISSEGESVDVSSGGVAGQLVYVHQLQERMSKEQVEMRSLISELEASRMARDVQATKQAQLEKQLEAALLAKTRLQELDQGRNAAINLEYLKNCVVGCLRTSEPSEHARLLPVITTILKLSKDEAEVIAKNISARAQHEGSFGGGLKPNGSGSGAGSWWNKQPPKR